MSTAAEHTNTSAAAASFGIGAVSRSVVRAARVGHAARRPWARAVTSWYVPRP